MGTTIRIEPVVARDEGVREGRKLGRSGVRKQTNTLLKSRHLRGTLGAMGRSELARYVMARLETPPDYSRYPELEDIYPEKLDHLRGFAEGAECSLSEAAILSYARYRHEIEMWFWSLNDTSNPTAALEDEGHCSGVAMVGPDGVIGGQSAESLPPVARPRSYRWKRPPLHAPWRARRATFPKTLVLRKPRTGYIEVWGAGNEKGVGGFCGNSCSVWLDDPIEDTWPIGHVPLLRFARDVPHLEELFRRYNLFNWNRSSQLWGDIKGNVIAVEKSFRRVGIRRMGPDGVLWCTEGHFESPEMHSYIREKRMAYLQKMGKHAGADDMQYANDCSVRFVHLGELCHLPLGRGERHLSRVLTDHATFPRAVCRHGGPDTDPYDTSVTMMSFFKNLSRNRSYGRSWIPWKKFPCQLPWKVVQHPALPG